ncbi:MAG: phosphatidylglycerophosphatase A [Elusimicrobia bacterium]|nr:phosphatidylglycerophosphatase A [Elusimicrobiota bacterium]
MKNSLSEKFAAFLASGFFLSHPVYEFRKGARATMLTGCGLVGSIEAVGFWLVLPPMTKTSGALLAAAVALISVGVARAAESYYDKKDDPRIVIDEFAGCLAAAVLVPKEFYCLAAVFVLFRVFDVVKPLGIRRLESLPQGWGCVLDDLASGILAGLLVLAASRLIGARV